MKKPYWGFLAVQLALPAVMGVGWLTGRTLVLHTWAYVLVLGAASLALTAVIRKTPGTGTARVRTRPPTMEFWTDTPII